MPIVSGIVAKDGTKLGGGGFCIGRPWDSEQGQIELRWTPMLSNKPAVVVTGYKDGGCIYTVRVASKRRCIIQAVDAATLKPSQSAFSFFAVLP